MKAKIYNRDFITLALIILLAFVLRFILIDLQSIWRDEAFSINVAKENFNTLMQITSKDTQPPLHLIKLHFWIKLFGDSAISVRFLSLIFGVMILVPAYYISKPSNSSKIFINKYIQYFFLLFICINPILIAYSVEARAYSMLSFFFLCAYYFFFQIQQNFSFVEEKIPAQDLMGFTIFSLLGLYTHNVFLLVLIAFGIQYVLNFWEKYGKKIGIEEIKAIVKYGFIFFSPTVLLYLPWLAAFLNQYSSLSNEGFWLKLKPFSDPINEFTRAYIGEQIPDHNIFVYALISIISSIAIILSLNGVFYLKLKSDSHLRRFIIIFAVIYIFSFSTSFIFIRYISFLVPILLIILTAGFTYLYNQNKKSFQILITSFFIANFLFFFAFILPYENKFKYREILSNIEYNRETDLILNLDVMSFHSTKYYLDLGNKVYDPKREIAIYEGTAALVESDYYDENLSNFERLWVVSLYGKDREEVLLINGFRFVEEYRDRELRVQLYVR